MTNANWCLSRECFCWAAAKQSGEKRELQLPSAGRPLCSTIDLLTEQKRPQVAKTNKCQSQCNCGSLPRSPRVQSLLSQCRMHFYQDFKMQKKKSFSIFIPTSSWQQTSSDVPATVTSSRTPSSRMFSFFIAPPFQRGSWLQFTGEKGKSLAKQGVLFPRPRVWILSRPGRRARLRRRRSSAS